MKTRKSGGNYCAAINCSNNAIKNKGLMSFFKFPKDPERNKKWVINSRRKDLENKSVEYLNKNCYICSVHFENCMFLNFLKNRLKPTAVPTIFNFSNPPQRYQLKRKLPIDRSNIPAIKKKKTDKNSSKTTSDKHKDKEAKNCLIANVSDQIEDTQTNVSTNLPKTSNLETSMSTIECPSTLSLKELATKNNKNRSSRSCSASGCKNNSSLKDLSFFRFPKEEERAQEWAMSCRREDLLNKSAKYMYDNCHLCGAHFEDLMFLNYWKNRLKPNASPTLFNVTDLPKIRNRVGPGLDSDHIYCSVPAKAHQPTENLPNSERPKRNFSKQFPVGNDFIKPRWDVGAQVGPRQACKDVQTIPECHSIGLQTTLNPIPVLLQTRLNQVPVLVQTDVNIMPYLVQKRPTNSVEVQTYFNDISKQSEKLVKYQKTIKLLQEQKRRLENKLKQEQLTRQKIFDEIDADKFKELSYKFLPDKIANFFITQVDAQRCSAKGRRYSNELKEMALTLYTLSPRAFKFMSKTFLFPSKRRLQASRNECKITSSEQSLTETELIGHAVDAAIADALAIHTYSEILPDI